MITLNFETEVVTDLYIYEAELQRQPSFFKMNTDQTVFITASQEDGIYYSFRSRKFIDIDAVYNISAIKEIMYDPEEKFFYLLANKYDEKLGLFILRFNEKNPNISHFFFKWKNKLDIADANITVVHNEVKKYKELVVSYKTIFINTYNVIVVDISSSVQWTQFRHESFQLWESQITGLFLNKNKDFLMINRDGISIISLSNIQKR